MSQLADDFLELNEKYKKEQETVAALREIIKRLETTKSKSDIVFDNLIPGIVGGLQEIDETLKSIDIKGLDVFNALSVVMTQAAIENFINSYGVTA